MHDKLYDLGFTEAAGNFQNNNFGRGGIENDGIVAYAQYGFDINLRNNSGFAPDSDGNPGKIYTYIWDGPTPDRDGGLDAELILHEYTHGLSTRLAGASGFITAAQSLGLGEGWSDFYALALLSHSTDDLNGNYPIGGYVTHQYYGLTENYYYGLRRYPYTQDMTKNPLTFKDIDPSQADNCSSGAPYNPWLTNRYGSCTATPASSQWSMGEVWCVTLWEARRNLISFHGPAGNQIMLQLVTDGMNLCPPNPNFIQARDAFFQAVLASPYCRDDWSRLWEAFSKRGMGGGASAPPSNQISPVVESFTGSPDSPSQD